MTTAAVATRHTVTVGDEPLSLERFAAVCAGSPIAVSQAALARAARAANQLAAVVDSGATVYGVTTAYGAESGRRIPPAARPAFQLATVRSHACGSGPPLDRLLARGCWLAKLCSLATGRSGASVALVQQLVAVLNAGLAPHVPASGSLGASGDLIPSGHAALPLVGEGTAFGPDGAPVSGASALALAGVGPLVLGPRDGLSLVNGTAATTSIAAHACLGLERHLLLAEVVAAAGLVAIGGHLEAFSPLFSDARPQPGVAQSAERVRALARDAVPSGSTLHDPYAWRCLPQVHGAARSAAAWARQICEVELASCTDNPLVDDGGNVRSGGNFHGAPLGLASDTLVLATGQVAALSRQRLAFLTRTDRGARIDRGDGGLEGTMLLTSATAALLELASTGPATPHWLPVDDVEDHVSNSTLAARRAMDALARCRHVLACETVATARHLSATSPPPSPVAAALVDLVAATEHTAGTPAGALEDLGSRLDELVARLAPPDRTATPPGRRPADAPTPPHGPSR